MVSRLTQTTVRAKHNKSISKYKVTPSEEISSGGNNKNEEAQEQQPTKKKSLLKSITDDTAVFIHEMQNNLMKSAILNTWTPPAAQPTLNRRQPDAQNRSRTIKPNELSLSHYKRKKK